MAALTARRIRSGARGPLRDVRRALVRVPPMSLAPARELGTMAAIAVLAGDWPTAVQAARVRLARDPADEGALLALAVGLWEQGREDEAASAIDPGASRDPGRLRAAVRYHHHLDRPDLAQAAADRLRQPSIAMLVTLGDAWRRHGEQARAVELADRALAIDPASASAAWLRRGALAEARVVDGSWTARPPAAPVDRVPGRVMHLLERSLPHHRSGSTYRTHYTVQAQRELGLEPIVVTQPGFADPGTELVAGVPHHRLAGDGARTVDARLRAYLEAAAPLVERLRPGVLHAASDYVNALVALELGRRYALPVVYEVRGFPEVLRGRWAASRATFEKARWRREVEADCWRRADRVVTLAEVMKRHIAGVGVDPERVTVVPNAVAADAFGPVGRDAGLAAAYGIRPGETVVGYVSTLSPYEGLPVLVEALALLTSRGLPVRGLIVGDGIEHAYLGRLAHRLGIGDRVVLAGRVAHEAVAAHLALMDVFVVPRTAEVTSQLVTPLKPYEAMAAERAVVVARTEALSEMVDEAHAGLTFTPEDARDLARVLEGLIADPGHRADLGRRAGAWVREHRTWRGNAARYRELYDRLGAL
jgi:glycosyltransferase involved in cell wall biosynthesis